MNLSGLVALLLYLATPAVVGAAVLGGLVAWRAGRPRWARGIALAAVAWLGLYGALLVGTSLASGETTLAAGAVKRFCGVYLDCHLGVQVVDKRRAEELGPLSARIHPDRGMFLVLTVRVSSNARRATLPFREPRATLRDADGNAWPRDAAAERALALEGGDQRQLAGDLTAGSSYTATLVFDVPQDVREPRLDLTSGARGERWSEMFLIGDPDSWLHAPTTLALP